MPKALRAEINDVVVKYAERKLRKDGSLDVAMMAHEMTQSLVDMIVEQEEHHHAPLFALMILSLGDEYLKRTGIAERRDNKMDVGGTICGASYQAFSPSRERLWDGAPLLTAGDIMSSG
jgi:hypothetical protein